MSDNNDTSDRFVPVGSAMNGGFDDWPGESPVEDDGIKLARSLSSLTDCDRVRPLKELAHIGTLGSIEYIYPFCHRGSTFLRRLARNAIVKIILRTLRDNEQESLLGLKQKKELLDFLLAHDPRSSPCPRWNLATRKSAAKYMISLLKRNGILLPSPGRDSQGFGQLPCAPRLSGWSRR